MQPIEFVRRHVFQASQIDFAQLIGVGQASVSRWEAGVSFPNAEHLSRLRIVARDRGLELDERLFFEVPSIKPDARPTETGALC